MNRPTRVRYRVVWLSKLWNRDIADESATKEENQNDQLSPAPGEETYEYRSLDKNELSRDFASADERILFARPEDDLGYKQGSPKTIEQQNPDTVRL